MPPDTKKRPKLSINKGNSDRVLRKRNKEKRLETAVSSHFSVAGAEGLEPSARGFGVAVEKLANHITAGVFGGVEPFSNHAPTSQNFLMIY